MPCFSEQRNSAEAQSIVWIFLVIFHCCRYNEGDETVWRAGCGIYRHAVSVHGTDTERNLPHMSNQILLTISILISNRPDTVRKCLDSIQPLLKKVPSELILVDTGCGESSRNIRTGLWILNGAGISPRPGMQGWKRPEGNGSCTWMMTNGSRM